MTERYVVLCSFLSQGHPRRRDVSVRADGEVEAARLAIEKCQREEGNVHVKVMGIRKAPD